MINFYDFYALHEEITKEVVSRPRAIALAAPGLPHSTTHVLGPNQTSLSLCKLVLFSLIRLQIGLSFMELFPSYFHAVKASDLSQDLSIVHEIFRKKMVRDTKTITRVR